MSGTYEQKVWAQNYVTWTRNEKQFKIVWLVIWQPTLPIMSTTSMTIDHLFSIPVEKNVATTLYISSFATFWAIFPTPRPFHHLRGPQVISD